MLDESGFSAAAEMGGFRLEKVPYVYLTQEPFWKPIFTSSALVGAAAKQSLSNSSPLLVS